MNGIVKDSLHDDCICYDDDKDKDNLEYYTWLGEEFQLLKHGDNLESFKIVGGMYICLW